MNCDQRKELRDKMPRYGAYAGAALATYLLSSKKFPHWNPVSKFAESMTVGYLGGFLLAPIVARKCDLGELTEEVALLAPPVGEYGIVGPTEFDLHRKEIMRTLAPTSTWFGKFRAHDPCGNIRKYIIQSSGTGKIDGRAVPNPEYERCKAFHLSERERRLREALDSEVPMGLTGFGPRQVPMGPRLGSPCDSLSKYADPSPFPRRLGGPPPKLNPEYVECRAAEGIRVYYRADPGRGFLPPKLVEEPMGPLPMAPSMTVGAQQAAAQQRAEAMAQKAAKSSEGIPGWVFLAAGAGIALLLVRK